MKYIKLYDNNSNPIKWEWNYEEETNNFINPHILKIGDELYAKDNFYMKHSNEKFLIKHKKYIINYIENLQDKYIKIKSEISLHHQFRFDKINHYFYIKQK